MLGHVNRIGMLAGLTSIGGDTTVGLHSRQVRTKVDVEEIVRQTSAFGDVRGRRQAHDEHIEHAKLLLRAFL